MPGWMRMAKKNRCLQMAQAHLYGHVAGAARAFNIPLSTGKNTVKGR